ncbi:MAG TPA: T9SS type A sorting domain-containing protein [Bacteroidia bacterium]|nr:T9SS type A sorting domain-containing protein [Bacteroidia bacterium]
MKKIFTLLCLLTLINISAKAQTNYLDNYIGNPVTLTTIGTSTNQLSQPRDLDFKPNSNELWVCNYGTSSGGSNVIFYNAGLSNQTSQYRKDTHTSHFMRFPSAMAFGDDGKWAAVSEILNTNSGTFMGPALWTSDTSIFARVFQNNWVNGFPLGSHLDMLHQSPFAMGIAHDSATAYWVMDGHFGSICKYDFAGNHGPGYDNHANGKIWRYTDVTVARVVGVPSHMVVDKVNHWLYYIDGVSKTIKRMNTWSGSHTGNLTAPNEPLALYWAMTGATVEDIDTLSTQPCGMDYYNDRLIVSDYTTGDIYLYNTTGVVTLMTTIVTGHPGMMGVKVGPDGHIWCVNHTENKVYRLDVILPMLDAAVMNITSPMVENYLSSYYSTAYDVCDGNITPSVDIVNTGTTSITDMEIHYMIDGGPHTIFNWTGSLTAGSTVSVSLPTSAVTIGSHQFDAMIMMVNGMADDIDLNNIMTGSFRVINPPSTLPFTEGFTATTFPPSGWNYVNFNPNNKMSRVTTGGFGLSVGSLKMDNYAGSMDITGQKDYLMLPLIDFTPANANTYLRFNVAYAKYDAGSNDRLQVLVSTDCGVTWSAVYDKSGTVLSTAPVTTGAFTPTATQWRTDSVSMATFAGQSELMMMFTSISNFGNNLYVDDIFIGDIATGISELALNSSLNIFPNPATNQLTIGNIQFATERVEIYDVLGHKVFNQGQAASSKEQITIDVSELKPGIYFLYIKQNQSIITRRVVIQ